MSPDFHPDAIPLALQDYDQWVCWRSDIRNGTQTKIPVDSTTGVFASTTDSATWASFDEAVRAAETTNVDGIGFVFADDDPLVGVDLDHCRVAETGTIHDWATELIESLDSYTEISPSGTGVHILVHGSLPAGGNRSGDVELYETARFFTVTGEHVGGTPTEIHERTAALATIHREHISSDASLSREQLDHPQSTAEPTLDDSVLIARAQRAANGEKFRRLWEGSTAGYDSHSEADMALCSMLAFWSGGQATQVDRVFRDSGLYRAKWDAVHFADGSTYGEKTVERAIASTSEFYTPRQSSTEDGAVDESALSREQTRTDLEQELNRLSVQLAERRETIETLEAALRASEKTNCQLEAELEAMRASSEEETESTATQSIWQRLWN